MVHCVNLETPQKILSKFFVDLCFCFCYYLVNLTKGDKRGEEKFYQKAHKEK